MNDTLQETSAPDKMTLIVFSGELDKMMAAFILATGASAMDYEVSMFFTFWGISALRKEKGKAPRKDFMSRMFGWMLPKGPRKLKLSKMNMMGMGTSMMKSVMKKKNVMDLPSLIETAAELGVQFYACEMSMNVMGLKREELVDGVKMAGVATALADASESKVTLFI